LEGGGDDENSRPRAFFRAAQLASLGLEMGIAVGVGAGIGYLIDRWLGTRPWFLIVFLLFGVAAGFKGVIDAARKASANLQASNPRGKSNGSERAGKD
jgi:ATP synthase protein I